MAMLSPADQQRLREVFSALTRPVHLLFFTQTIGCETCPMTRQILDELPPLSDRVVVDEVNMVLDTEKAQQYGIDRAPAVAIAYEQAPGGALTDSRIRFLGAPSGYEFMALVHAVLLAGGGESELTDASRERLAAVNKPLRMHVFTTPT